MTTDDRVNKPVSIDEVAWKILHRGPNVFVTYAEQCAMAKLWLMRGEIMDAVGFASDAVLTVDCDDPSDEVQEATKAARELYDHLKALEGE